MAMTRNQRRRAKARNEALSECNAHNTALVLARKAIVRDNLSSPIKREATCKISPVYTGSGSARAYGHGVGSGSQGKPKPQEKSSVTWKY